MYEVSRTLLRVAAQMGLAGRRGVSGRVTSSSPSSEKIGEGTPTQRELVLADDTFLGTKGINGEMASPRSSLASLASRISNCC